MNYQSAREELIEEEIAFWNGFIEWWRQERAAPVPPRAWETLACAKAKRRLLRSSFADYGLDCNWVDNACVLGESGNTSK